MEKNNISLLEKALLIGQLVDLAGDYEVDADTIAPEVPRSELLAIFKTTFGVMENEFADKEYAKSVVSDLLTKSIREYIEIAKQV